VAEVDAVVAVIATGGPRRRAGRSAGCQLLAARQAALGAFALEPLDHRAVVRAPTSAAISASSRRSQVSSSSSSNSVRLHLGRQRRAAS
jgi:hypothetical protein